jgi:hypothetical protein
MEQSLSNGKATLLITPCAGPASSLQTEACVDKEQCGGWCRLALKRVVAGLVSQVGERLVGEVEIKSLSIERKAFLCFFKVYRV